MKCLGLSYKNHESAIPIKSHRGDLQHLKRLLCLTSDVLRGVAEPLCYLNYKVKSSKVAMEQSTKITTYSTANTWATVSRVLLCNRELYSHS